MKAWFITDWPARYEVTDKGRAAGNGDKLRAGPLAHIRWKVNGKSKGAGYRRLEQVAGSAARLEAAWALWGKLVEIAADNTAEFRGWILNEQNRPATADDLVFFTGFRKRTIETAIEILMDTRVRWICEADFPEIPGNSRKFPKSPVNSTDHISTDQLKNTSYSSMSDSQGESDEAVPGNVPCGKIVKAWNAVAKQHPRLPLVRSLSDKRRMHLRARWQEQEFRDSYARIFEMVGENSFLRGEKSRWRADFDWLIKNDENYLKVLEGKYDEKTGRAIPDKFADGF